MSKTKIINPQTIWRKVKEYSQSVEIRELKEQTVRNFILDRKIEHPSVNVEECTKFALDMLKRDNYSLWYQCTSDIVCFIRKPKADSYASDVWVGACHHVAYIYLRYAQHAYPKKHWYILCGDNTHSCIVSFKEPIHYSWYDEERVIDAHILFELDEEDNIVPTEEIESVYDPIYYKLNYNSLDEIKSGLDMEYLQDVRESLREFKKNENNA